MTDELILYFAPGACSRISLIALEQTGAPYQARPVALMQGEQQKPEYLALNPKGKVPLLVTQHGLLSENLAIIQYLDAVYPAAGLLPPVSEIWARAQAVSWLAWCSTTLHPMIYRIRMTARIHPDAETHPTIRAAAVAELAAQMAVAEHALLDGRPWIAGPAWSAADAALFWIWSRGTENGLDAAPFPKVAALAARVAAHPATVRAIARESAPG